MSLKTSNNNPKVRLSQWLITILLAATMSGCLSQAPSSNVSEMEPGHGLIIGSVTFGEVASGYRIFYQKKNARDGMFGIASQGGFIEIESKDFDSGKTELFAISLPEGEYEISSWRIVSGKKQIVPKDEFSIAFAATAGQATYVGNFDFQNTVSSESPSSNLVSFSNFYDRDVGLLKTQYEQLDLATVTQGIDSDFSLLWTQAESDTRRSLLFVVFSTF